MLANSILSSSKVTAPTMANSTALISQINLKALKAGEFLSQEEFSKKNRSNHRRFTTMAITLLVLFNMLSLWLLLGGKSLFAGQNGSCKIAFFSNFYVLFLFNFALVGVLIKNLQSLLKDSQKLALSSLSKLRNLLIFIGCQIAFAGMMFFLECSYCSQDMMYLCKIFAAYQIIQFSACVGMSLYYHHRVHSDFDFSAALDEEASAKVPKEEKFNGSFALNLSKNGKSSRELFRYKKKIVKRTAEKRETIEFQMSLQHQEFPETVKEVEEPREIELQLSTPPRHSQTFA